MTVTEPKPAPEFVDNDQKPVGHGRMLRKEDPRFVRGLGRYVDDIQLPGMLHLAILRSPLAHARIVSVDISAAQAHPKVRLVVTGEAFDFGQRRDDNPHIRLYGEYTFRKEQPRTPRLFVTTGVDNALNDTAFLFGGGLRWRDEDLKYLLGSIPVGR